MIEIITKVCKYCGKELPIEQFRKYYGNRKGRYAYCSSCEKLLTRQKYLCSKHELSVDETEELEAICTFLKSRGATKRPTHAERMQYLSSLIEEASSNG